MTPEMLKQLLDLGSAGAVILVVVIFLRSNEKRDKQWRDFFTALNKDSKEDLVKLADTMARMVKALDLHDAQAKEIKDAVARIDENTKPLPPYTHDRRKPGL